MLCQIRSHLLWMNKKINEQMLTQRKEWTRWALHLRSIFCRKKQHTLNALWHRHKHEAIIWPIRPISYECSFIRLSKNDDALTHLLGLSFFHLIHLKNLTPVMPFNFSDNSDVIEIGSTTTVFTMLGQISSCAWWVQGMMFTHSVV